jgi:hypothetical protein
MSVLTEYLNYVNVEAQWNIDYAVRKDNYETNFVAGLYSSYVLEVYFTNKFTSNVKSYLK